MNFIYLSYDFHICVICYGRFLNIYFRFLGFIDLSVLHGVGHLQPMHVKHTKKAHTGRRCEVHTICELPAAASARPRFGVFALVALFTSDGCWLA